MIERHHMRTTLSFLLMLCLSASCVLAEINAVEQKIAEHAASSVPEAIALLEKTANINSGTMNHEGVRQVGEIFRAEFDSIGFETRWIPMAGVNRSGHLFAERKGNQGKRLLLIGHLDTVFEKENPFEPFTVDGSRATGQGVNDMKGGNVVALYALKALQKVGALENTNIIVAFTGDEEMPGEPRSISRKDLIEAAKRSDIALGFESAEGMTGTIARRGISDWTLKVTGKQGHSSLIFNDEYGLGAIFETARILNSFREKLVGEQYLTFNPGVIVGGTEITYDAENSSGTAFGKTNVISRLVTVEGDLRFISVEQRERARDEMRKIIAESLPRTEAEITFSDGYPSMSPTEGNEQLLKMLDQVSRDLGHGPMEAFDPGQRGAADIAFVSHLVDGLDGLGAAGLGGHTPEEDIDLEALPGLIQRAAILIYRLTR